MKSNISKVYRPISASALILFLLLNFFRIGFAEDPYIFERMWPEWQHPWYFNYPRGITVDKTDHIWVLDSGYALKFTLDGQFVTKWRVEGGDAYDVATDAEANVYVAIPQINVIRKYYETGELIAEWNNEGSGDGEFNFPCAVTVDAAGDVYVVDADNNRVQKFNSEGQFITKWGSFGTGKGEFNFSNDLIRTHGIAPRIATDSECNVYVTDTFNSCVQKFNSSGQFLTRWGTEGSENGEFHYPTGITMGTNGRLSVFDLNNSRIQQFNSDGDYFGKWGFYGSGPGGFDSPRGNIASDSDGNLYVSDTYNHRIQKFDSNGQFLSKWGPQDDDDEFIETFGVASDSVDNFYVIDVIANRLQQFSSSGAFLEEWREVVFGRPTGIACDSSDSIYIVDWPGKPSGSSNCIQKFSSSGRLIAKWGKEGSGEGEFSFRSNDQYGGGVAVDGNDNVYVLDTGNFRVQKFTQEGDFITKWGSEGTEDGQFVYPVCIAADFTGNVYVGDYDRKDIQKFSSDGTFVLKWGEPGSGDGEFFNPSGLATDSSGNVYVADRGNRRIQKFTPNGEFITKWGTQGTGEGQFLGPLSVCVGPDNRVYVGDVLRVQVFSNGDPPPIPKSAKAIIVAGGGPYEQNNIWDATRMCANYAYRALTYQGYSKENLYYLSADTGLDLDGNGVLDDVDADATNANLQYAIQTWARDADELLIYMVDHGGNGTFRMGAAEILYAQDLDTWLDSLQQTLTGPVTMVYDACESGSFLPHLLPPSGKQRILAASASPGEESIFVGNGTVSFSFLFWGHMFNGESFYDAFVSAKKSVSTTYRQTPLLDANGNGIGNEKTDKDLASLIRIGNETKSAGDVPVIGSVSPHQDLENTTSALIYADQVVDADGISRVWAVITPPGYSPGSTETPVTDLPTIDLPSVDNNRFEATYTQFTASGTYNIAIFALDRKGVLSLPVQTTVTRNTACLRVGNDLGIRVPCVVYNGSRYSFLLDFYRHPDDRSGFYWKLVIGTLSAVVSGDCISIGVDLSMPMPCVFHNGLQYGFMLRHYDNPYDPSGYYWKMDMNTLIVE